jgi:hypothetical protein
VKTAAFFQGRPRKRRRSHPLMLITYREGKTLAKVSDLSSGVHVGVLVDIDHRHGRGGFRWKRRFELI